MDMDYVDLNTKSPSEILNIIAKIFESAREDHDIDKLNIGIEIANALNTANFDIHSNAILYYFLGNAWSYILSIKAPNADFPFETIELEEQIKFYRKAYELIKKCDDSLATCQILTNIGNLFIRIGRFSEAQDYYDLCLQVDENFGMAIGNKGFGLLKYARVIFEPTHQFIFMQYARKNLLESKSKGDVYPEAMLTFQNIILQIESLFSKRQLNDFKKYKDYYKGLSLLEVEYRKWCVNNRLFINPLNDILKESVVANDYLFTPSMILKFDEKPIYQTIYNQLKQEYVCVRYLFYESTSQNRPHFSDKEVVLMDTLDYAIYSFNLEKVKITFRVCYSLFDKIAYLINLYLNLGIDHSKVNFRNIWYKDGNKKNGLNNKIQSTNNLALRGLFWLSKDLDEKGFDSPIEPEAKEIATIRNYLEHKSFKIVESLSPDWFQETETYEIERSLFLQKTLKILKLSRSALMYLSFLIYIEESMRRKEVNDIPILPIDFLQLADEEKV